MNLATERYVPIANQTMGPWVPYVIRWRAGTKTRSRLPQSPGTMNLATERSVP